MIKVYLLVKSDNLKEELDLFVKDKNIDKMYCEGNFEDYSTQIRNFNPDILFIEMGLENSELIIRQLKADFETKNIQIIFLTNENTNEDISLSDGIIEKPLKENIIKSTINSHYKIKQSLDRLYENNKELSKSLYQLNVLYNTSSGFAGTLNTEMLYEIMLDAMEKTLSFDISSVLVFNSSDKLLFTINSIHRLSQNLVNALKIRSILNYKEVRSDDFYLNEKTIDEIEVITKIKQERSNKLFSLEIFNYDTLFAPIKVGDDFFGVIEIYRQKPFTKEDVTCFQAIAHQVALPLRSAKLYEQISTTNKKLEKLEKIKSEFISIVSHELRTPLTPINNSLEIVLSNQTGVITPEARNFISMAKRNIQRLSGIIEDLLDLSRIQTGKLDFKYKIVNIVPSLELLQKTFLQVAQEKNIQILLDIKDDLPEIYADIRRIEQIFSNLVSNSLKFTSNDGLIKIEAKTVVATEINQDDLIMPVEKLDGKYIQISVIDNGIGIDKKDIPKIFDKFSQIETSLNRNKGGVGLGLTITKQLIDSHLGAIYVDSEEKKGSTFSVLLPFIDNLKMFKMHTMQHISLNNDFGIIQIKSEKYKEIFDNVVKEQLTKFSKSVKEFELDNQCLICINKISLNNFELLYRTIEDCINKDNYNDCDILLNSIHNKKDGTDIAKIMELLNL